MTPRRAGRGALGRLLPWAVGAAAGALALGPALGPGYVLRYDMVAVPEPPLSQVTLGGGGGFPRAVPSDAVLGALGLVLPGDAAQALLLMAVFTLAGAGAGHLVPRAHTGARVAAALFYVWNPFVAERLLLGQWAVLLGYAGLPWVAAAVARAARAARGRGAGGTGGTAGRWRGRARWPAPLVVALLPAAVGGFSSMVLSALVGLATALLAGGGAGRALRRAGAVAGALVLLSLPWLVPALGSGARTDPAAVDLFAARADTPFGAVGSLVSLGGIWNVQAVPEWYGLPVLAAVRLVLSAAAVAGWVWLLRRGGAPGFGAGVTAAAVAGLLVALAGVTEPGRAAVATLIGLWPGFGPLRDGHLYVAPLALLQAAGMAGALMWLRRAARAEGAGHDEARAPGEPLISSEADRPGAAPHGFARLWTTGDGGGPAPAGPAPAGPSLRAPAPGRRSPGAGPRPPGRPRSRFASRSGARVLGAAAAAVLALAPVAALPGLAWGAAGRLAPAAYPDEWRHVQAVVNADDRPGRVLVLPWSAYRGLDWRGDGHRVVVLDPATKLFDRRAVWNDDLRVETGGAVRVVEGEDPLARRVDLLHAADPGPRAYAAALAGLGIRYVLVERSALPGAPGPGAFPAAGSGADPAGGAAQAAAALGPLAGENRFSLAAAGLATVHDGAQLTLLELPDQHVVPTSDALSGLEASAWFVTVGAILWSIAVSGSSLVSRRPAPTPGAESRKEHST
ncbi:hypothetical protein HNR12_002312 [Streptomonospora nanhaiensis]|uniref:Membrane protein 6-pyruvoyl-tetrahydropterin synthase-related domain-containing protein n=1 Tax=Streptomonospora nanhaiensis TaxID=1323731 RepID=A0A853BMU9_9ACTN|nr:hypothetical protein [Streptomonospora nanhaiensis]NYI96035.1 hypothetical protein [Streptomonospora nanhaiensis]